jgi:polar amino acid transport system permease protein
MTIGQRLRWGATWAVVLVLAAMLASTLVNNHRFQWGVAGEYLFDRSIIHGLGLTLLLTVICMAIGILLGLVLAILRRSPHLALRGVSNAYVWVFRGTPVLVQVTLWYNLAALYPRLSIGVPFGPTWANASANSLISPLTAAILGLGLNEAAYMAEIFRSGLLAVDSGQHEAAFCLGLSKAKTMRLVILPQVTRIIIPPTGNQVISMLKSTSIVSVISLGELLRSGQDIYSTTYQTIPLLLVVSLWYLFCTTVLTVGQALLEWRLNSSVRALSPGGSAATRPGSVEAVHE